MKQGSKDDLKKAMLEFLTTPNFFMFGWGTDFYRIHIIDKLIHLEKRSMGEFLLEGCFNSFESLFNYLEEILKGSE